MRHPFLGWNFADLNLISLLISDCLVLTSDCTTLYHSNSLFVQIILDCDLLGGKFPHLFLIIHHQIYSQDLYISRCLASSSSNFFICGSFFMSFLNSVRVKILSQCGQSPFDFQSLPTFDLLCTKGTFRQKGRIICGLHSS